MGESERRFFAGRTLGQAVLAAASHYGVEPEELSYRKVDKRHGFLKTRWRVVIEVDPEEPRRTSPEGGGAIGQDAVREREDEALVEPGAVEEPSELLEDDAPPVARSPLEEAAVRAVSELLELACLRLKADVVRREEVLEVDLSGPDRRRMWARHGELMRSMEHLVPRLVREQAGGTIHCRVDCDGFWKRRQEELKRRALKVAREVRDKGTSRLLEPLNPAERRVVHLALAEEVGVSTESEGDRYLKRIRVRPWDEEVPGSEEGTGGFEQEAGS